MSAGQRNRDIELVQGAPNEVMAGTSNAVGVEKEDLDAASLKDTKNTFSHNHVERLQSPDFFSDAASDDERLLRAGRIPLTSLHRQASKSPAPQPEVSNDRLKAFWIRNKGLACVVLSQVFGCLMNGTTRLLELHGNNGAGFHPFQILFARMSITVLLASLYMYKTKTRDFPLGARELRPLLLVRGITGFLGVYGMYYSLLYLPLADATVLTFLAPSIACWACSYVLHEPFTRMEQIAAAISLSGVVLIARPAILFGSASPVLEPITSGTQSSALVANGTASAPAPTEYTTATPAQRATGVVIGMIGVLGTACVFTVLRSIGQRAHALISVNYLAMSSTLISLTMMLALPSIGFHLPANGQEWAYLLFLGLCGFIMQFLLSTGLAYEKSSRATNMVYTQMLFALAFDKVVFDTTPGALSILGSSLILGSAIYVAVRKEGPSSREREAEYAPVRQMDEEGGLDGSSEEEREASGEAGQESRGRS